MKIYYFICKSAAVLFYLFNICLHAQTSVLNSKLEVIVSSSEMDYDLKQIEVTLMPIYEGTEVFYLGQRISNMHYEIEYPIHIASEFQLQVSAADHEKFSTIVNPSQKSINVELKYNNYHKTYNVDPNPLIEIFNKAEFALDQVGIVEGADIYLKKGNEIKQKLHLPVPIEWLYREIEYKRRYRLEKFYYKNLREKLYYNFLKEIVLQTTAYENRYNSKLIKIWIKDNYDKLGGTGLLELERYNSSIARSFGEMFAKNFTDFFKWLKGVNIATELLTGFDRDILEATLLKLSYDTYQELSFIILKEKIFKSDLYLDVALQNAVIKLEEDLKQDREKSIQDFANEFALNTISKLVLKETLHSYVPKAFSVGLGMSSTAAGLTLFFVKEIVQGLADDSEMQASLIILAQIDRYILKDFPDKYRNEDEMTLKINKELFYGTLMRIHCGYLFNKIREEYFSAKKQNFVYKILKKLFDNTSIGRKIVEISIHKKLTASSDYLSLSLIESQVNNNLIDEENICLGFILDSSGSMNESDPMDIRKSAVKQIIDLLEGDERIFIIDFDEKAKLINKSEWENWDREALKNKISFIDSEGGTDIGGGIEKLRLSIQDKVKPTDKSGIILLTDGMGEYNNEADWFSTNNIPIYTISYKDKADSRLMNEIAKNTNGIYIKANDADDIVSAFTQFYNELSSNSKFVKYEDKIMPGEFIDLSDNIYVDDGCEYIYANNSWSGSKIGMKLMSPDSIYYTEDSDNAFWSIGDNYSIAKIINPTGGAWEVQFEGIDVPSDGEKFSFELNGKAPIQLELKHNFIKNGKIELEIVDKNNAINISAIKPKATIITPTKNIQDVSTSFKDGKFNFYAQDGQGEYKLEVNIEAMDSHGNNIQRYFERSILVEDFIPSFVGKVEKIIGSIIYANLGDEVFNRPGIKCYLYKSGYDKSQSIAIGNVTFVNAQECQIEIQQYLKTPNLNIGDIVELDVKDWSKD